MSKLVLTGHDEEQKSPPTFGGRPALVYRGERLAIPESFDCHVEIKKLSGETATFKINDVSAFGIRVISHNKDFLLLLNEIVTIGLYFYNVPSFEATASVANEGTQQDTISYGLSFISAFVDLETIRANLANNSHRGNLQVSTSLQPLLEKVRPEFKMLVADLNSIFKEIQFRLEQELIRIADSAANPRHHERMIENLLALAVSLNLRSILDLFSKFHIIVSEFSPEENSLHKKYFRLNFGDTIEQTPFLNRAFNKPLGYPGDYGLMVMFYNYQDLGESIFDKFMHRLSCNQPIAIANQNRVGFLADLLESYYLKEKSKDFKISSIACGPAQETAIFLERANLKPSSRLEVVLVDQESKALDYALENLKKIANKKCDFQLTAFKEDAVLGVLKQRPFVNSVENSDVIICAGLYDYLSDRVAAKLTEQLIEKLAPGGVLLVGNVSTEHPNKFSMDYFMEWNLVLRNPPQLIGLVPERFRNQNGYTTTVISESLGINLFLEVRRSG